MFNNRFSLKRWQLILPLTALTALTWNSCSKQSLPEPPMAKIEPHVDTVHGEVRVDNYYWLRDRDSSDVIEYLNAENTYTDSVMAHTQAFQDSLFQELKGRIKETDLSVPHQLDDYFYYSRTQEGQQYKIYCRKKGNLDAAEEILMDVNQMAEGHEFYDMGGYDVSTNHQLMAYVVDTTGSEHYTVYFKDLTSGTVLNEKIDETSGNFEWANDNKTLFYTTLDEAHRPFKLFRHELGATTADPMIYHEDDDGFFLGVSKTRSMQYLLMEIGSSTTTEAHYLDANKPSGKFKLMRAREHEIEYYPDHRGDKFYIRTNEEAKNYKVVEAPVSNPAKANWTTIVPHNEAVRINNIDVFENHLVLYERENGLQRIRIRDLRTGQDHNVSFPEPTYSLFPGENFEFQTNMLRYVYMSLVTPKSVYDYGMDTREQELKKQDEVLGGFDAGNYQTERIFATAPDGAKVPISIAYRKGMKKDGTNPTLLYGYGSYGYSMDPWFSTSRISLLDRGFIFALANIRGGSEMGEQWYDDGKLLNKKNTFTDYIACAEFLVAEKYTTPQKLVAEGGSAGGLLMGAIANMRPDLFKIVVAEVPFVDVINTMLDASIPLTVIEYEEWGNPNEKEYYDYMLSYSPYDNVTAKNYPTMLITAGLNDPRVQYWEPAKWTAKLRTMKTDKNTLLLKTNMGQGHMGASGRYDFLKEVAFDYAFIFDQFGITN